MQFYQAKKIFLQYNTQSRSLSECEEKDKVNSSAGNRRAADVQLLLAASLSLACDVVAFIGSPPSTCCV